MSPERSYPESQLARTQEESHTRVREASTPADADAAAGRDTHAIVDPRPALERWHVAHTLPRAFGQYLLQEELGRGGMGIVYRAHDRKLDRVVALKVIRGGFNGPEETERFLREAKAVAQLKHPHIIKIHDFGQVDGQLYFTTELARRGSLAQHLSAFVGQVRPAVALMEKVARAVDAIHASNLLHRDLKPGNILLETDDAPVVTDFGLAKQLVPTDAELTATGAIPGTPPYMAPEQFTGLTPVSRATDTWSLGVILFELVCGRRPFTGPSKEKISDAIVHTDPPEPRVLQPGLDRSLEAVILKALRRDPTARYATAADLADDLARWQRGEPTVARPLSWPARMARRYRKALGGLVLAVLVGATAMIVPPPAPEKVHPDGVLEDEILPALRAGQRVVLLGPTGKPAASKWIMSGGEFSSKDGEFGLHSGSMSLLELLPRMPVDRYDFRAEVRHIAPSLTHLTQSSVLGIYCCRSNNPQQWGSLQSFCAAVYTEAGVRTGVARLSLYLGALPSTQYPSGIRFTHDPTQVKLPALAPVPKEAPWRHLRVRVTPQAIDWEWENETVSLPRGELLEHARILTLRRHGIVPMQPGLPPGGGLGLFVEEGQATFRNVSVEPLVD